MPDKFADFRFCTVSNGPVFIPLDTPEIVEIVKISFHKIQSMSRTLINHDFSFNLYIWEWTPFHILMKKRFDRSHNTRYKTKTCSDDALNCTVYFGRMLLTLRHRSTSRLHKYHFFAGQTSHDHSRSRNFDPDVVSGVDPDFAQPRSCGFAGVLNPSLVCTVF